MAKSRYEPSRNLIDEFKEELADLLRDMIEKVIDEFVDSDEFRETAERECEMLGYAPLVNKEKQLEGVK